jgi:hypothetical protein
MSEAGTRTVQRCVNVWVVLLLITADCGAFADGEPPSNVIAEFRFDVYRGIPRLPVAFGNVSYVFGADTGSGNTSLEPGLRPLLTRSSEEAFVLDAHAIVETALYRAPQGRIGPVLLPQLDGVLCYEHKLNRVGRQKIDGILGMDALHPFVLRIDFDAGTIAFLRTVPREAGERLTVDLSTGRPIVDAMLGSVTLSFVLDTGSDSYGTGRVSKREFDDLVAQGALAVIGEIPVGTDFAVALRRAAVASAPFSVGHFQHTGLVFCDFEPKYARQKNTLGIGFLRRFVLTFDFPHSSIYLSPSDQFTRVDASRDPGGVRLARQGARVVATHLLTAPVISAPVPEAGVHVGDTLETVNGVAVSRLNDVDLARGLSDTTQPTALAFRRPSDGTVIHVRFDEREVRRRLTARYNAAERPAAASEAEGSDRGATPRRFRFGKKREGGVPPMQER